MSNEVALKDSKSISLFPSESEWAIIKDQATTLVKSGLLPRVINTPEKAIAIAIKGRELGIPMMQAFSHIHIIDGKPGSSAELMLSLILRNCKGAVIDYLETSDKRCEMEVKRPGGKPTKFSFTIEEARRANLLNKDNWKMYPAAMLRARAIAIAARAVFPDAIMGMSHLADELGAVTDEDGQVIEIQRPGPVAVQPPPPVAETKPAPKEKPKTRGDLISEIMVLGKQLRLEKTDIERWVMDVFKKGAKDLSLEELDRFVGILTREVTGV